MRFILRVESGCSTAISSRLKNVTFSSCLTSWGRAKYGPEIKASPLKLDF